jgi:hypothetical protein
VGTAPPIHVEQARAASFTKARTMMADANRLLAAFYVGVAASALVGQVQAATHYLHWAWYFAAVPVTIVELGGVALCAYADARRRLGERALAARLLSAAVAAAAVALNWFGHTNHLPGAVFAGLSALGYLVWLLNSEARRRDQLRADGKLPEPPPAYDLAQWACHPWITRRARAMAKADPTLGLYGSLAAAQEARRREQRNRRLARALQERIGRAVDPNLAAIAVLTYDLDELAARLRDRADYDALTDILAAELSAAHIAQAANVRLSPTAETAAPAAAIAPAATASASADAPTADARLAATVTTLLPLPRVSLDTVAASVPERANGARVNGSAVLTPLGAAHTPQITSSMTPDDDAESQDGIAATVGSSATVGPDAATSLASAARQRYRDSVSQGSPLTGKALGQLFGRSESWGRERIRDATRG